MLITIVFYIIVFVHNYFKTRLPFKWDFCGLHFAKNSKFLINNASYLIVYAAFTYPLVLYTLHYLRNLSQSLFSGKCRFLAYVIAISAATKVFWRLFLLTTYFFTGSFYPWFAALGVVFLNFPSALRILTSRGKGLLLMFQGFGEFVKNSFFERVTRRHTPSEYSVARTLLRLRDAWIPDSTEGQPIVRNTESLQFPLVMSPPIRRIPERERPLSERPCPPIPPRSFDADGFHRTEDNFPLSPEQRQLKQLTETFKLFQNQLASRQQESIPSTSAVYLPNPSQQSHTEDEIPGVSKQSYINKLGLRSKGYADENQTDSNYQEKRQTSPKQTKSIRISQIEQSHLTVAEELDEGEKVSKRKVTTEGKIRSTTKGKKRIRVPESTAGIHRENGNFPLGQDLPQLQQPYRTRSGLIYGLMRR